MNKSKGFTLIELMIVIAIVAILAAIIWPVITGKSGQNGNINVDGNGNDVVSLETEWQPPTDQKQDADTLTKSCVEGVVILTPGAGAPIQLLGADGKPVACTE